MPSLDALNLKPRAGLRPRPWRALLAFGLAALLAAGLGIVFVKMTVNAILDGSAIETAEQWLPQVAEGRAAGVDATQTPLLAWRIVDREGRNVRASSSAASRRFGAAFGGAPVTAPRAGVTAPAVTRLHFDGSVQAGATNTASLVTLAIRSPNNQQQFAQLIVDDAARYDRAHSGALKAALVLCFLSAAAIGLPGIFYVFSSDEAARANERMAYLARHDDVTGLANGHGFEALLDHELASRRDGDLLAVISIDIRGFKRMIAGAAPRTSDALLTEIGARIRKAVRHTDTAARIGGDHFAVLVRELASGRDCHRLSRRIVRALAMPMTFEGQDLDIACAVGVALAPADGETAHDMLRAADIALCRAKADSERPIHFYKRGMDRELAARRSLEVDLRDAIANDELVLHYQPQVALSGDRIVGYEALLRWQHPERGMVPPGEFIPLAEESGLITRIGRWVLMRACEDAALWPKPYRVAVNLSAKQLATRGLVQDVQMALKVSGLNPRSLELEVTETALLSQTEATMDTLHALKALGASIAMDDFGTGYSSLSHLLKSPFDTMKIDRAFVSGIGSEGDATAIVRAVVRLGHSLNLRTIAEGVETPEQIAFLRAEGCNEIQGFLISKPLPMSEISLLKPQSPACAMPPRLTAEAAHAFAE